MDKVTDQAHTEAMHLILNQFGQDILAAFYKSNRYHNNEIT